MGAKASSERRLVVKVLQENGESTGFQTTKHEIDMKLLTLMLPVWYNGDILLESDVKLARTVWNQILNDESEEFRRLKGTPGFAYTTAVVWFFDTFYNRLFEMYPSVKPLFKNGLVAQGRFLVKMLTLLLGSLNNEAELELTLYKLVQTHNSRGIKAVEYGMVGEVIFYTLRKCTGTAYTVEVSRAWIKVFSRMLKFIVPKAVAMEIETNSVYQGERFKAYHESLQVEEDAEILRLSETGSSIIDKKSIEDECPFGYADEDDRVVVTKQADKGDQKEP